MIFMCLGLCIVHHFGSSNPCSCLSFTIIISLPPRKFHCLLLHSHSLLDHFFLSQGNYKVCPPSLPPHSSSTFSCSLLLFLSLAPCPGFKPNEFFTFPLCLHKHLGMFELLTGVSNGQVARQEAVESTV